MLKFYLNIENLTIKVKAQSLKINDQKFKVQKSVQRIKLKDQK
jgi:hypothetical protein